MSVFGLNDTYILPVIAGNPLIVLAKVVGFDKAEYGLENTRAYPLLFEQGRVLVCMSALSNFRNGRYGPVASIKAVWENILTRITGKNVKIENWPQDVKPMYTQKQLLPSSAKPSSIKKGVEWFNNGRFFVHPSWKADWEKYGSNGYKPVGPPLGQDKLNGDGSMGIIEGHISTIYNNGTHQYRYWMRADVQGEVSMALAAAGSLFNNNDYKLRSARLINYMLKTSNLRAGEKNEGSLIFFRNGEKSSCLLYRCNFALFSLNEAASVTGDVKYKQAVNKLSDFLTRVQSKKHKDVDGAWFRGFDYGRWDYWGSNSDAGWGYGVP